MMPETRHFCPHCEETVSLSTFHRHRQLFFNETTQVWRRKSDVSSDSGGDEFEPEDMNLCSDSSLSDASINGMC